MADLRARSATTIPPATASKLTKAAIAARGTGGGGVVLFNGASGKGQIAAAEKIAADARRKLELVDATRLSKFAGETERELDRILIAAEQKGWILFFDEADALFGSRTGVSDSHDRYANAETNYLLDRLEHYRGLVVLATNRPTQIPPRLRKRYLVLIDFPMR